MACVLKTVSLRLSKVGTLSILLLSISIQLSSDFDPVSNPLSVKDPSSGFSNILSVSSSSSLNGAKAVLKTCSSSCDFCRNKDPNFSKNPSSAS